MPGAAGEGGRAAPTIMHIFVSIRPTAARRRPRATRLTLLRENCRARLFVAIRNRPRTGRDRPGPAAASAGAGATVRRRFRLALFILLTILTSFVVYEHVSSIAMDD